MLKELVKQSRSYRRFYQSERISENELKEFVECARFAPSTVNSQAIKFMLITSEEDCAKVFDTLAWAGMLKDWQGPEEGERPSAYILLLCDLEIGKNKQYDDGICAQTIMLAAAEKGYGGCILGSIDRPELAKRLGIDTGRYSIDLCLALGKPKEQVVLTDVGEDCSTAYYRDENGTHYVPKRTLDELIVNK